MAPDTENHPFSVGGLMVDILGWTKMAIGEVLETVASHSIGQGLLKIVDKILWIFEKSAQWTLPASANNDNAGKQMVAIELVRPLPWIFFLPILLMLRISRETLSLIAFLLKKEPIRPSAIVRFIQSNRRSLRAIKYQGLRSIRIKHQGKPSKSIYLIPRAVTECIHWFIELVQKVMCFNAVKYSHDSEVTHIIRVRSSTSTVRKRMRSQDELSDNLSVLISDVDISLASDSDSSFSMKEMSKEVIDTSKSSSDEELEDDQSHQPEVEQIQTPKTQTSDKTNNISHTEHDDGHYYHANVEHNSEIPLSVHSVVIQSVNDDESINPSEDNHTDVSDKHNEVHSLKSNDEKMSIDTDHKDSKNSSDSDENNSETSTVNTKSTDAQNQVLVNNDISTDNNQTNVKKLNHQNNDDQPTEEKQAVTRQDESKAQNLNETFINNLSKEDSLQNGGQSRFKINDAAKFINMENLNIVQQSSQGSIEIEAKTTASSLNENHSQNSNTKDSSENNANIENNENASDNKIADLRKESEISINNVNHSDNAISDKTIVPNQVNSNSMDSKPLSIKDPLFFDMNKENKETHQDNDVLHTYDPSNKIIEQKHLSIKDIIHDIKEHHEENREKLHEKLQHIFHHGDQVNNVQERETTTL